MKDLFDTLDLLSVLLFIRESRDIDFRPLLIKEVVCRFFGRLVTVAENLVALARYRELTSSTFSRLVCA